MWVFSLLFLCARTVSHLCAGNVLTAIVMAKVSCVINNAQRHAHTQRLPPRGSSRVAGERGQFTPFPHKIPSSHTPPSPKKSASFEALFLHQIQFSDRMDLIFFSIFSRATVISRPHLTQTMRISEPIRMTLMRFSPQGCFFFISRISPTLNFLISIIHPF